jgi:hypothetical protein
MYDRMAKAVRTVPSMEFEKPSMSTEKRRVVRLDLGGE